MMAEQGMGQVWQVRAFIASVTHPRCLLWHLVGHDHEDRVNQGKPNEPTIVAAALSINIVYLSFTVTLGFSWPICTVTAPRGEHRNTGFRPRYGSQLKHTRSE